MEQKSNNLSTIIDHKKNLPNAPLVQLTRTFRAPVERVFSAWSNPEFIKQWWGPAGFTAPSATTEFRVGGKYLFSIRSPDGKEYWSTGVYLQIIPNEKILCTDQFADENGNTISAKQAGMTGNWPETVYITVDFEKTDDDHTNMTVSQEGVPQEIHDDSIAGWNGSLDKLQRLVERN